MNSKSSSAFLSYFNLESIHVIDRSISKNKYVPINLSTSNRELKKFNFDCYLSFENYIHDYLKNNDAEVAFGGYLEPRNLYKSYPFFNDTEIENQRNIHLGIDLWVSPGTQVLAAYDGEVHSFYNNINPGDYGPTIILKHNISGVVFHTLYGHLSTDSLNHIKEGDKVTQGELIGHIGISEVNGLYAPHLHFQIINDMQSYSGDYPGVSNARDLDYYKNNCPDPNIILGLDLNKKVKKPELVKAFNF